LDVILEQITKAYNTHGCKLINRYILTQLLIQPLFKKTRKCVN